MRNEQFFLTKRPRPALLQGENNDHFKLFYLQSRGGAAAPLPPLLNTALVCFIIIVYSFSFLFSYSSASSPPPPAPAAAAASAAATATATSSSRSIHETQLVWLPFCPSPVFLSLSFFLSLSLALFLSQSLPLSLRSIHETQLVLASSIKTLTPCGGRLTWTLPPCCLFFFFLPSSSLLVLLLFLLLLLLLLFSLPPLSMSTSMFPGPSTRHSWSWRPPSKHRRRTEAAWRGRCRAGTCSMCTWRTKTKSGLRRDGHRWERERERERERREVTVRARQQTIGRARTHTRGKKERRERDERSEKYANFAKYADEFYWPKPKFSTVEIG